MWIILFWKRRHHECTSGRLRASGSRYTSFTNSRVPGLFFLGFLWRIMVVGIGDVFLGNYSRFPDEKLFPVEKVLRELFLSLKPPRKPPRPPRLPPSRSPLKFWKYVKIRIVFTQFSHEFPKLLRTNHNFELAHQMKSPILNPQILNFQLLKSKI